eukprot:349836-Chlamydomonas_euryale.AAC.4
MQVSGTSTCKRRDSAHEYPHAKATTDKAKVQAYKVQPMHLSSKLACRTKSLSAPPPGKSCRMAWGACGPFAIPYAKRRKKTPTWGACGPPCHHATSGKKNAHTRGYLRARLNSHTAACALSHGAPASGAPHTPYAYSAE